MSPRLKRPISSPLTEWRVGKTITRLVLLKTKPGYEVEVGERIEKRCASASAFPGSFRVFRLFGLYDLLVIQDGASLGTSDFVNVGSLSHVTGSAEYVCSNWRNGRRQTFSLELLAKPLIAVCFLKINPDLTQRYGLLPELSFASYIQKRLPTVQMLSSLGWSEAILLISESSVQDILTAIGTHIPSLMFGYGGSRPSHVSRSFAEKTVTIIGHSLNVSSGSRRRTTRAIVPFGPNLGDSLSITYSLACKPRATATLAKAATTYFGITRAQSRLGTRDLEFDVPLAGLGTLNDLLRKLDGYARDYSHLLIRTHTVFKYTKSASRYLSHKGATIRKAINVNLPPKEAALLSRAGLESTSVATAVYQFNNLLQTDVSSDVYLDLLRFIVGLKNVTLKRSVAALPDGKLTTTFRRALAHKLSELDVALVQRSQTVFAGFKESPLGVYPTGVGLQRVIKALEAYALTVLQRNGITWNGFVRFGHLSSRMEHFTDILVVPMDATVCANRHWTFTHEIMHVLQMVSPQLSIRTIRRSNQFGAELPGSEVESGSEAWFVLLESMVDVLDYALCCGVSLDKYLSTVWRFLDAEIFGQHARSQLRAYLWRSFSVIAFDHYGCRTVAHRKLFDRGEMLSLLMQYTTRLSKWTDLRSLREPDQRGETGLNLVYEQFLNEFVFYLPSMFRKINELMTRRKRLRSKPAELAIRQLRQGRILTAGSLSEIDKLAWTMGAADKTGSNNSLNVAWLLSLWHHYQVKHLGPMLPEDTDA